jgi:hypothetical protein
VRRTLERAKTNLRIISEKDDFRGGLGLEAPITDAKTAK